MSNVLAAVERACELARDRGYWASSVDEQIDRGDIYCRCCLSIDSPKYIYFGGGVETLCLSDFFSGGRGHLSWCGDSHEIMRILEEAGLESTHNGSEAETIQIILNAAEEKSLPPKCNDCGRYSEGCDCEEDLCPGCGADLDYDNCECGGDY